MRLIEQKAEKIPPEEFQLTPVHKVSLGMLGGSTPHELVALAVETATELRNVINSQKLYVDISGKRHVKVEGWTTLGIMLGCIARELSTTETDGTYTSVVEY